MRRIALTQPNNITPRLAERIVLLDSNSPGTITGVPPPRLPQTALPDDPAYVIYTSGSTGVPKGVTIQHRAARNTLADLTERWSFCPHDRVLWVSSLEFDLSIFDLFGILGVGGAVVIPPPDGKQNPLEWAEAVHRHRVTVWNSVPALAELMLTAAGSHTGLLLASLRIMMLSGDWIPLSLAGRISSQIPACRLYSLGGATEASIWSIFHPIEELDPQWVSIPYGKPLRNQTFHRAQERSDPLSDPHHRQALHRRRRDWRWATGTIPNRPRRVSFTIRSPARRLYDTGDLGRYRPDGSIEFLGREDQQVKLRGYRIELGEIEAALSQHPQVQTAVALLQHHSDAPRIVAYVVPSETENINVEEMREWAVERLPEYMVPSAILLLDRSTTNSKR